MYIFSSKRTVTSKTVPGVEIVLRKMTESRRQELVMATSDVNSRLAEKYQALRKLREDKAPVLSIQTVSDEINALTKKELIPLQIKWGVAEIRGLRLEEPAEDASVDNATEWPVELFDEVQDLLEKGNGLSELEVKN